MAAAGKHPRLGASGLADEQQPPTVVGHADDGAAAVTRLEDVDATVEVVGVIHGGPVEDRERAELGAERREPFVDGAA